MEIKSTNIIESALKLLKEGSLELDDKCKEIEETLAYLKKIIHHNQIKDHKKKLIFVAGSPGSGKTLTALRLLNDYNRYKLKKYQQELAAVYISRNSNLVNLIQDKLDPSQQQYLRGISSYKWEHMNNPKVPREKVIIFDDAQRAWDEKRMKDRDSEADFILKTGHKIYRNHGSATIISFIGEGQRINKGEEDLTLWQRSLDKRGINDWQVYAPPQYQDLFKDIADLRLDQRLNLNYSMRSNLKEINQWIEAILGCDLIKAKDSLTEIYQQGFNLRLTRDFAEAKSFVKDREKEDNQISYGLLVSSKGRDKEIKYQINGGRYYGSFMELDEVVKWFAGENKRLEQAASEFACQGLELDYSLVCFGGDYYYNGQSWEIDEQTKRYYGAAYQDFSQIIENIYRVLLSRARQGMILYIPKLERLDRTYETLVDLGIARV